jgi:GNAT superfamily N-acetyltransferase
MSNVTVAWCETSTRAAELAAFFAGNVGPDYISHAELQGGRALSPTEWRPNLVEILRAEIDARLAAAPSATNDRPIAVAEKDSALVALALLTFADTAPVPFAIVEDLIVGPQARGRGVGKTMLDWIARQAQARGIRRLFLESGAHNDRAHAFFGREGFRPTSIVMMRELD